MTSLEWDTDSKPRTNLSATPTAAPIRSDSRRFAGTLIITVSVAMSLGLTLRMPTLLEANDISRWCTVWALLERGTYAIDDCPWHERTQDKVRKPDPFDPSHPERYYSSKPPLLPTMIAGMIYPFRKLSGTPLDAVVRLQERHASPGQPPLEPAKWPAYIYYLKPTIIALNVVPMLFFLIYFARFLDRAAPNDWSWIASLTAAAFCTQLFFFNATLNNHTVAAYSGYFASHALVRIWRDGSRSPGTFLAAGVFGAFCACNELPAAFYFGLLAIVVSALDWKRALIWFLPAALLPAAAWLATQHFALGTVKPVYAEFGTPTYLYDNSYWKDPKELDALGESKGVYLFHMVLGHHGVLSLTPIFLFSAATMLRGLAGAEKPLRGFAIFTAIVSAAMIGFYAWKTNNYGGSTQGLRWLFWLFPLWLMLLPPAFAPGQTRSWFRGLVIAAIFASALSTGYGMRSPWTHPWILDAMEHADIYPLKR